MAVELDALNDLIKEKSRFLDDLQAQIGKVIVGQGKLIDGMLIAVLCRGHALLEGVPGLAKTLSIHTLAQTLDLSFRRIQFTPDLLPADITGGEIYNARDGGFEVRKGPVFANVILADEINRAPAKTQSALLEAMQERQVTIGGQTFTLPSPFITLATQNPIEQEGTYPLPEAQVDRFMLKIKIDYPSRDEEIQIVNRMATGDAPTAAVAARPEDLEDAMKVINQIYIDQKIIEYIVNVVESSRKPEKYGLKISQLIQYGASPRASIFLTKAARARAFLKRRGYVTPDDVKTVGMDVLRHRIIPTYEADAENIGSEEIIKTIFDNLEVP
ncbi:MAG: AAA family ATPase [Nitrospinota bacterium]|nr:AAA family ATPase [Nitrospinota bacterium]